MVSWGKIHLCSHLNSLTRAAFLSNCVAVKPLIHDEFTNLPVSRQRKYQLRKQRDGLCTECGEPAASGSRCVKHLTRARERQRKRLGLRRRYRTTLSYRLAEERKQKAAAKPQNDQPRKGARRVSPR